jgi:hypothetical protein
MAAVIQATLPLLPAGESLGHRLVRVVGPVVLGGAVYLGMSKLLRCEGLALLLGRRAASPATSEI